MGKNSSYRNGFCTKPSGCISKISNTKNGAAWFTKGPFIYYISTFLGFLDPSLPLQLLT
jgi:hypothetical protein